MTKYYIETTSEDFIIDIPEGTQVLVKGDILTVVEREVIETKDAEYSRVTFNDHTIARYQGVKACRSEQVKRLDPEVA